MIDWHNKSDRHSVFFSGQMRAESRGTIEDVLRHVFNFLLSELIGKGNAAEFDRLFLEVNCDTGRILAAATTNERKTNGRIDGCSIRIQELQDYWYDLIESGKSDEDFTKAIADKVSELGQMFRQIILVNIQELLKNCSKDGFKFVVYGSDPGVVHLDQHFSANASGS